MCNGRWRGWLNSLFLFTITQYCRWVQRFIPMSVDHSGKGETYTPISLFPPQNSPSNWSCSLPPNSLIPLTPEFCTKYPRLLPLLLGSPCPSSCLWANRQWQGHWAVRNSLCVCARAHIRLNPIPYYYICIKM